MRSNGNVISTMPGIYCRNLDISRSSSSSIISKTNQVTDKKQSHHDRFAPPIADKDELVIKMDTIRSSTLSNSSESKMKSFPFQNSTQSCISQMGHSAPASWRKRSLHSIMNTVPDPDVDFMFVCTSAKQTIQSESFERRERNIRDDYSSYRQRTSPLLSLQLDQGEIRDENSRISTSFSSLSEGNSSDRQDVPIRSSYSDYLPPCGENESLPDWGQFVDSVSDTRRNADTHHDDLICQETAIKRRFLFTDSFQKKCG